MSGRRTLELKRKSISKFWWVIYNVSLRGPGPAMHSFKRLQLACQVYVFLILGSHWLILGHFGSKINLMHFGSTLIMGRFCYSYCWNISGHTQQTLQNEWSPNIVAIAQKAIDFPNFCAKLKVNQLWRPLRATETRIALTFSSFKISLWHFYSMLL